uniref:Uncharacterized protein n=1 Tax=uncultured Armatimonadetes bacterium TaxID=157466 RepID=A0A6J4I5B9_9BACT|nr:hypothetical protein AVDCRST_MAG63-2515 [uncultured Armatimonadetes bacterium]
MNTAGKRGVVPRAKRKIVYCGLDVPWVDARGRGRMGPEDLLTQIPRLRHLPFDGIAINLYDPKFPYPQSILGNNLFGSARHTYAAFARAVPMLKELRKTTLRDNFFLIATGYWFESGKHHRFDWFDDARWRSVENNLRVYARIARESGVVRGFLIDVEPYRKPESWGGETEWAHNIFSLNTMFNLVNQLPGGTDARGAYLRRVRDRGRRFFRVLDESLPGAPLLFYHGNGQALNTNDPFRADLFPAFLDGILEEIERRGSRSYVIDGVEAAYKYRGATEYKEARRAVQTRYKTVSSVPALYAKHVRVGFGKWLDAGGGSAAAWNAADVSRNFYSPQSWEQSLKAALDQTDEYVWIWSYGEGRIFPMSHNRAVNVPKPYLNAIWRARRG